MGLFLPYWARGTHRRSVGVSDLIALGNSSCTRRAITPKRARRGFISIRGAGIDHVEYIDARVKKGGKEYLSGLRDNGLRRFGLSRKPSTQGTFSTVSRYFQHNSSTFPARPYQAGCPLPSRVNYYHCCLTWIAHQVIEKRASGRKQGAADTPLATTRRLKIMPADCFRQLTLWDLGPQQVTVDFQGGSVVTDAGLLPLRLLDRELGVLAELARRLPDPRAQKFVTHSLEAILTQEVYQILAGYPDGNDAQALRHDPLFQTLVNVSPSDAPPLASGSTLNRFHHAFTRREAELPLEDREVLQEIDTALTQRIRILNEYLPELFIRTRTTPPAFVILDIDPSDDPTHGQQVLSFYHGYYEQHQYFPLFVFDGVSGFPLAAWLRPGTVAAVRDHGPNRCQLQVGRIGCPHVADSHDQ